MYGGVLAAVAVTLVISQCDRSFDALGGPTHSTSPSSTYGVNHRAANPSVSDPPARTERRRRGDVDGAGNVDIDDIPALVTSTTAVPIETRRTVGSHGARRSRRRGAGSRRTDPAHGADPSAGNDDHHDRAPATAGRRGHQPQPNRSESDPKPPATRAATQPPADATALASSGLDVERRHRADQPSTRQRGLAPLSANAALNNAAAAHRPIGRRNQMTHTGSNGSNEPPRDR